MRDTKKEKKQLPEKNKINNHSIFFSFTLPTSRSSTFYLLQFYRRFYVDLNANKFTISNCQVGLIKLFESYQ